MKTFHPNQFKTALVCAFILTLQSCAPPIPGSWKNDSISSGKRDDFHELNTQALRYLKANNPKGLKALLSKDMMAKNNERIVEQISYRLADNAFDLMDEYYLVHKYKDTDTVANKGGDVNRYRLHYPYVTTEMYIAFFVPKKPANKYIISLVYGKFDYGWKIVDLQLNPYAFNGKTAPQLFVQAKDQYAKKQFQTALNNAALARMCWKPGSLIQYPDEIDATKFYLKLRSEVELKYRYPLVLRQLATAPMILRIYSKKADNDEGTFPLIYYMTHFDLKDTAEVKKENLQIRAVVNKLMPGIEDGNKYIFYSAFNKQPTGYVTVDHFDMVQTVK